MTAPEHGRRTFLALCGTVALSGCTSLLQATPAPKHDWPTLGYDSRHAGYVPDATLSPTSDTPEWTVEGLSFPYTSPVVAGGSAYVASADRGLQSVDADDGTPEWRAPLSGTPAGAPAAADGVVFVAHDDRHGDGDAVVSAFEADGDAEIREPTWEATVGDDAAFAPTVADGTVFVTTSDAAVALSADDGEERWRRSIHGSISGVDYDVCEGLSVAVDGDAAYVPGERGVLAVDANDGTELWRAPLPRMRASPAVSGGTVYATGVGAGVRAFAADSGEERWRRNESGCWTSPAVAEGSVYATAGFDLVELDAESGEERWRTGRHGLRADVRSSPAVVGDTVVLGTIDQTVVGLDPGAEDDTWGGGAGTHTSPAVSDGRVFATDGRGLHAFGGGEGG
ncbi:outer membrane protein assembly factor BamB family protein [Halegenticoccus tardaugens]|uniref:outer membrane protein assembly factor BamB family protein n=1 Tax=Halegenticoccus tardaugens TaxID=2071624 RepID=UPI00100B907C|nr:PQQ-binding-like beta-propeller repeat protein [Halegenticoccus tardaugens]